MKIIVSVASDYKKVTGVKLHYAERGRRGKGRSIVPTVQLRHLALQGNPENGGR